MDFFLEVTGIKLIDLPVMESHFPSPNCFHEDVIIDEPVRNVRADGSLLYSQTAQGLDSIYFKFTGSNKVSEICFGTKMSDSYHYKGKELAKYSHTSASVDVVKRDMEYCNHKTHVDVTMIRTFDDAKAVLKAANVTKIVGAGIIEQTSSEILVAVLKARGFDLRPYCCQADSDSD